MRSRRRLAAIAFVGLTACIGNGTGATEPEAAPSFTPDPQPATPSFTPDVDPGADTQLLYLDGPALHSFDLGGGARALIAELPSADAALSPDGRSIVVVQETSPLGMEPEGFRDPVLMIAGSDGAGAPSELGPGRSPVWSPSGTAVAAIAPTEDGETIVTYGVPGGPRSTAAPRDERWSIVGWADDGIVAIGSRSGAVNVSTSGDTVTELAVSAPELWGVSPDDGWLVEVRGGKTFTGPQIKVRPGRRTYYSLHPRLAETGLGDGSWSWDGRWIAAVSFGGPGRPSLSLIDVDTPVATQLEDGAGAQGNVVWSADNRTFAFVRVKPDQRTRLEALVCTIEATCEPAFSWGQGVTLLGFR